MHIFLVNDDGIGAKGIMALFHAAVKRGHRVSMCAPRNQQSAASHSFTLTKPIYVEPYAVEGEGSQAFSITGSPVDCVRIGLLELVKEPVDILISGINNGYNAGMAVHYSGTVGAAMEGAMNHLPAIAASIHHEADEAMIAHLANLTIEVAQRYYLKQTPHCTVLNINAPNARVEMLQKPIYAPLSVGNFIGGYERREAPRAGTYYWLLGGSATESPEVGSDMDCLEKNHVTFTLMGNPACLGCEKWEEMGLF